MQADTRWGIPRFQEECWNNDWLQRVEEDAEHGGSWLDLFTYDFAEITRQVAEAARLPENWQGDWRAGRLAASGSAP